MCVIKQIPPDFPDSIIWDKNRMATCCRECSNHPVNGGGDYCTCDKPLLEGAKFEKIFSYELNKEIYVPC